MAFMFFVTVLMVLALSLDSANLFLAKIRLQYMVDIANIDTVVYEMQGGSPNQTIVEGLLKNNLEVKGLGADVLNVVVFEKTSRRSKIEAHIKKRLWFGSLISGGASAALSSAVSEISSPRLNIGMVLDNSASMIQDDNGDGKSRLSDLKDAAELVVQYLRPGYDNLMVVGYNYWVKNIVDFESGGLNEASSLPAILTMTAGGGSNIAEAIEVVVRAILSNYGASTTESANILLVIGDGGASYARLRVAPSAINALPANNTPRAKYDYYITRHTTFVGALDGMGTAVPDSSLLTNYARLAIFDGPEYNDRENLLPDPESQCWDYFHDSAYGADRFDPDPNVRSYVVGVAGQYNTAIPNINCYFPTSTFLATGIKDCYWKQDLSKNCRNMPHPKTGVVGNYCCLKNINILDPLGNEVFNPPLPIRWDSVAAVRYTVPILETDYARLPSNGITVYTVGLGPNSDHRFFRRLALDSTCFGDSGYLGTKNCSQLLPNLYGGAYFNVKESSEIPNSIGRLLVAIMTRKSL